MFSCLKSLVFKLVIVEEVKISKDFQNHCEVFFPTTNKDDHDKNKAETFVKKNLP